MTGFGVVEGPRTDDRGQLYFGDKANGGVYVRRPDGQIDTVVADRARPGGILLHADGGVVVSGEDVSHIRDGRVRRLFAPDGVLGFNDLFADRSGRVFAGSLRTCSFQPTGRREAGELYCIDGPDSANAVIGDVELSNGIAFSPDGTTLYLADSSRRRVLAAPVGAHGHIGPAQPLVDFERGFPGGLVVDAEGGLWVAMYACGHVVRVTPGGEIERSLALPARAITSLCFGGPGLDEMYVASADNTEAPERKGCIFRLGAPVRGLADPAARI